MVEASVSLDPASNIKQAYHLFKRYGFNALPIVDKQDKIIGVVPYRDVMNLKHKFL
jgi:Mg/Co/Ni transporter MgtE